MRRYVLIIVGILIVLGVFVIYKTKSISKLTKPIVNSTNLLLGGSDLWKFTSSLLQPVVSTWDVYAPANLRFDGEIQPDGSTCSNGEILKKTGANNWDCATDNNTGGSGGTQIELKDVPGVFNSNVSSVSFDGGKFTVTASGSAGLINLDWGQVPSLSTAETITGNWEFTGHTSMSYASVSQVFEVGDSLKVDNTGSDGASVSIPFEFTSYASASQYFGAKLTDCDTSATSKLLWTASGSNGGRFSCGTDANTGSVGADTLNYTEFLDSMALDANLVIASAGFSTDYGYTDLNKLGFVGINGDNSGAAHLSVANTNGLQGLRIENNSAANTAFSTFVTADSFTRFSFLGDGVMKWGDGTAVAQTMLQRMTANTLNDPLAFSIGTVDTTNRGRLFVNDTYTGSVTSGSFGIRSSNTIGSGASFSFNSLTSGNGIQASFNSAMTGLPLLFRTQAGSLIASLSAQGNFENVGYASASKLFGANLATCNATTGKLTWSAGLFGCGTDFNTGGSSFVLDVGDGNTYHQVSSISFDAPHFTTTFTASQSFVRLDWGAGGPASLSEAETIAGNWVNTTNPWADNEVVDTLTVTGGIIGANSISGTQTTTGTLTIGDNGDSIIIDASNWDISTLGKADFLSASVSTAFEATGYASASLFMGSAFSGDPDCNDSGEAIGWDNGLFTCLSISAAFDATAQDALTWSDGANASNLWTFDLSGTDPTLLFRTGGFTFTGGVSVSAGFEVGSYASISNTLFVDTGTNTMVGIGTRTPSSILHLFNGSDTEVLTFGDTSGNYSEIKNVGDEFRFVLNTPGTDGSIWFDDENGQAIQFDVSNHGLNIVGSVSQPGDYINVATDTSGLGTGDIFVIDSSGRVGIGDASPTTKLDVSGSASVSSDFEVDGYASASKYYGAGLTPIDCNDATDKLLYSAGLFTCGTLADADIPDTITASNYLPLAGGTLTGNLVGTNASFSFGEFTTQASASKYFGALLADCDTATTSKLLWTASGSNAGKFSCGTDANTGSVGADTLDYTEFKDVMTLDASTKIASGGFNLDFSDTLLKFNGLASISLSNTNQLTIAAEQSTIWSFGDSLTGTFSDQVHLAGNGVNFSLGSGIVASESGGNDITIDSQGTIFFNTENPSGLLDINNNASVSSNFEVIGYASASLFRGSAFAGVPGAECSDDGDTLAWNAGVFTCGDDDNSGGSTFFLDVYESGGTQHQTSSVSFDLGKFNVSYAASVSTINLDWASAGGPASLSEAETITGNWVNTTNPWADNEVIDALTVTGGIIGANSISGTQTTTGTLTFGDNGDSIIFDASNWDISTLGKADFLSASVSTAFEAKTYASASFFQGSAFTSVPGAECSDAGDTLNWANGLFTCGTDGSSGVTSNSLNFDELQTALVLDANLTVASTSSGYTIDWGATNFKDVGGIAVNCDYNAAAFIEVCTDGIDQGLRIENSLSTNIGFSTFVTGDGFVRFTFLGDGKMEWGGGAAAADTNLYRNGVSELKTDDSLRVALTASISSNFEVGGFASASQYLGKGINGAADCNDATDKLLYDVGTGLFTCGVLTVADTSATGGVGIDISTNDFIFDATELEAVTWGAGGNAVNIWTFNLSAGDPTLSWTTSGATLSSNFEAIGYASASKYFTADLGSGALTNNQFGIDNGGFGQFVYRASASEHILTDEKSITLSIGSSSSPFVNGASRSIGYQYRGGTVKRITCQAKSATSISLRISRNGTTDMDTLVCGTARVFDDGSISNSTYVKGDTLYIERTAALSGEVDIVELTYTTVPTRE